MNTALDLELIKTFLTVVTTGCQKTAAAQLHKSPSAISMQLKRLEEVLGRRILERNNQGITLTDAGRTVRAHGESLLRTNNLLLADLRRDEMSGVVSFGAPADYGPALIHKLLPLLNNEFPLIDPKVVLEPSRLLRGRVKAGDMDIAIVACEINKGSNDVLWTESVGWFGKPKVDNDIERIALLSTDCILRDMTLATLNSLETQHTTVFESTSISTLTDAVCAGFGSALLPVSLVTEKQELGRLMRQDLPSSQVMQFEIITSSAIRSKDAERLRLRLAEAWWSVT
ncbi:DNA-binding transcriptional LysR family regulator [Pseudomonas sp. JUb42]|uniref:LysR family transcriptional regulator n=1 Tax=Pseudomonas sp. JUb42 TaxID=2940611 RepID=UPI002169B758|nr:LysR family transcriptional regulator [Pseudomonas sp. JUb42]MCS3470115.1 DNA-binding transcriptional LysR family regulator [Pseudomonas sp. JUb42]